MRRFFFLNREREWQGPFLFPTIVWLCLKGEVHPTTYLWTKDKNTEDAAKPSESISRRKQAYQYKLLPVWIFGENIEALYRSTKKKWTRKIQLAFDKEKKAEAKLFANPIESTKIMDSASRCYVVQSITSILDFPGDSIYDVKLLLWDRDEGEPATISPPIQLSVDENPGIKFSIIMDVPPQVSGVMYHQSYGLHRRLLLKGPHEDIFIPANSVFDFSTKYPRIPQTLRGRFREVCVPAHAWRYDCYYRLIMQVEHDVQLPLGIFARAETLFFDHEHFNVHDSLMGMSFRTGGGCTEIAVRNHPYRIFEVKDKLIFIECRERQSLENFQQETGIIRVALALLSGNYFGGVCHYLSANEPYFQEITGILYKIERLSVISDRSALDLQFFRQIVDTKSEEYAQKYKLYDRPLQSHIFSALCKIFLESDSLRYAAELVISGMGNHDPLQQGALYSVAIEAITEELGNRKNTGLKPIPKKEIWIKILAEWKQILQDHKDELDADMLRILETKLENLNNPPNQDRLTKTFELYGLSLEQLDIDSIANRNDFLHGRDPSIKNRGVELEKISLRLHTLIVALILKYIGYEGHIINLDVKQNFDDVDKGWTIAQDLFAGLRDLLEKLKEAKSNQDIVAEQEIVKQIQQFREDNQMPEVIRMI